MAKKINWYGVGQMGREIVRPVESAVKRPFQVTYDSMKYLKDNFGTPTGGSEIPLAIFSLLGGAVSGIVSLRALASGIAGPLMPFFQTVGNLPYFLNIPAGIATVAVSAGLGAAVTAAAVVAATPVVIFSASTPFTFVSGLINGAKESLKNMKQIILVKDVQTLPQVQKTNQPSLWSRVKDDMNLLMQSVTQKLVRLTMPHVELVEKDRLQSLVTVFEKKTADAPKLPAPRMDTLAAYLEAELGRVPLDMRVQLLNEKIVPAVVAHLDDAGKQILYTGEVKLAAVQRDIDERLGALSSVGDHARAAEGIIIAKLNPDPLGAELMGALPPPKIFPSR